MTATLDYLLVEDAFPAAIITLNRPQQLNPLSTGLMKELTSELERQSARPEVRAIVLKGAGRAFSAGHDLKEMLNRNLDRSWQAGSTTSVLQLVRTSNLAMF